MKKIFFPIKTRIIQRFASLPLCCHAMTMILLIFFNSSAMATGYAHLPAVTMQDGWVVNGMVVNQNKEPVSGASVTVMPGNIGTSTDEYGRFAIQVHNTTDSITVSSIGYLPQTVVAGDNRDMVITLEASVQTGDEVTVTVAFGQKKKTELVGSQTVVNPSDLKVPSSNLTSAFAGKIAGMIAFQRSGEPGQDNANFFIRGVTTFGYKQDPLILIDNIEVSATELARLQPDDIASFSIMKDATATALYGSRAANGVIFIKTKEGRADKVNWNARVENSFSSNTKNVELADPVTYMRLENESVLTRDPLGTLIYQQNKIDNTVEGANPNIYPANDWRDLLVKKVTSNQRANLNVSGGSKVARYYISGTYNIDNGILKVDNRNNFNNNIKLNTYQLRSNVNINLTKMMEVTLRLGGLFDDYTGPIDGGHTTFLKIMGSNPVLFPAYYPAEDIPTAKNILFGNSSLSTGGGTGIPQPRFINPYADMVKGYRDYNTSRMFAQFEAKHDLGFIAKGLSTRFLFNTSRYSYFSVSRYYNPFFYEATNYNNRDNTYELVPLNKTTGTNYLSYNEGGKDINTETYYEWAFDYTKKIEDHQITALVVGTRRNRLLANQGTLQKSLPYRNQGVSGRLTYGFDNRYIAEFNFGYNGSERFHSSQRYGFFPSIGAAYNISREKFWDPIRPVVNDLKLRATFGYTGNDAIGTADDRFFYLSTVNMSDASRGAYFGSYYNYWLPGITISRYSNEEITWETARKTNIGLDAKLFNSLNFVVEFFKEYRDNILMDRAYIPATLGLSAPIRANLGKAESKGIDMSMDYSKNFGQQAWVKLQGNFTYSTGRFLFYEEPAYPDNEYYLSHTGQSINQNWGLIAERLFIDENDVKNSPKQNFGEYMAGDIKYYDTNGDGEITDLDRVPIGFPTVPEIIYGGGVSAGYKNFDLSFFLQGSARSSFWIDPAQTAPFVQNPTLGAGSQNALLKVYADDYWSEDNRNNYALWPRLSHTVNQNNNQLSTWFMRNGAFLRLKSVELGYTLPKNLIKRMNLNSRIYVNGLNLLTFSQFKYWDIEMGGNGLGYPIQKVINLGLTVNF